MKVWLDLILIYCTAVLTYSLQFSSQAELCWESQGHQTPWHGACDKGVILAEEWAYTPQKISCHISVYVNTTSEFADGIHLNCPVVFMPRKASLYLTTHLQRQSARTSRRVIYCNKDTFMWGYTVFNPQLCSCVLMTFPKLPSIPCAVWLTACKAACTRLSLAVDVKRLSPPLLLFTCWHVETSITKGNNSHF